MNFRIALSLLLLPASALAEQSPSAPGATFERPSYESPLPVLVEIGTYHNAVSNGYGYWRGADATVWIRKNPRFTPVFQFNSQTRPGVTQQSFSFFSFANWSKNFYTTQGAGYAPQRNGISLFASRRFDLKGFYKLPVLERRLLLTAGVSQFNFQGPVKGQIYNVGFLYYPKKMMVEGNYYINRNQPGNKIGNSASIAVQYGQEGKYWVGTVVGGGKEVYTYIAQSPLEVNLDSVSTQIFVRKWLSRHYGVFMAFDQQTKFGAFTRAGVIGRVFFEF